MQTQIATPLRRSECDPNAVRGGKSDGSYLLGSPQISTTNCPSEQRWPACRSRRSPLARDIILTALGDAAGDRGAAKLGEVLFRTLSPNLLAS